MSIMKENLPGEHLDLANDENLYCTMFEGFHEQHAVKEMNRLLMDSSFYLSSASCMALCTSPRISQHLEKV